MGATEGNGVWKVLVADDDPGVHRVTELALANRTISGRTLSLYHAYDSQQVCSIVGDEADIAVVLLDLVMEAQSAGLDAARTIRRSLRNPRVRIVFCTGDMAPILRLGSTGGLDITECWPKTALTADRLWSIVQAAVADYGRRASHAGLPFGRMVRREPGVQ